MEVTRAGQQLHVALDGLARTWSSPDAILIQHGVGRSGAFFGHWVPLLSARYQVVRPDLRGHGRSGDPGAGYVWQVSDLVADTLAVMDALELEKVHFIGESAGGVLGLALAAFHPERVHTVTALSSPLAIPQSNLDNLVGETGHASMQAALRAMSLADWTRAQFESGGLVRLNECHEEWVVSQWCRNRVHVLTGIMAMLPGIDLEALLPKITVPALFLAPTRSPLTNVEQQGRMAKMAPQGLMRPIRGSAHEIYVDCGPQCITEILSFLEGAA